MKIALGSDAKTHLSEFLAEELERRGHAVTLFGPPDGDQIEWPEVAQKLASAVADGAHDQGVLCC